MTICICLVFGRGVFNYDLLFSYNFLWRSAPGYSLEEEFSFWIYSFPINSYDDLHLATLWKRNFQLGTIPFLQIPMTICTWLLLEFSIRIYSFPTNSYDDLHLPTLWEEEFSIRIYSFPTNSYDDLHLPSLWKRSFQLGSTLFLQIPMTICTCLLFGREVFN